MYDDEFQLSSQYNKKGYKDLGCVLFNQKACEAYNQSINKEEHKIGKCYYFIVMHDLKAYCTVDSSD